MRWRGSCSPSRRSSRSPTRVAGPNVAARAARMRWLLRVTAQLATRRRSRSAPACGGRRRRGRRPRPLNARAARAVPSPRIPPRAWSPRPAACRRRHEDAMLRAARVCCSGGIDCTVRLSRRRSGLGPPTRGKVGRRRRSSPPCCPDASAVRQRSPSVRSRSPSCGIPALPGLGVAAVAAATTNASRPPPQGHGPRPIPRPAGGRRSPEAVGPGSTSRCPRCWRSRRSDSDCRRILGGTARTPSLMCRFGAPTSISGSDVYGSAEQAGPCLQSKAY